MLLVMGLLFGSESEVTYLGAILDQTLSGASTARSIITKSTNKLKFVYRNVRSQIVNPNQY